MVNVLLVDDDEDDRDLFCLAVHDLEPGFDCALARNGEEALQGLRMERFPKPHLIFLDLNMPRLDGLQFLREIKKDLLLQDISVAIYTTSKWEKDVEEAKRLGAAYFLTKPSSFRELCKLIADVFEKEMLRVK